MPSLSDPPRIVLAMIKLSSTEYETLMPFLGYAPARLQERVIALIGSRPIRAGYSWTEEADGHNHHWQGLAVVGNGVLLVNATAPAYPEHVNDLHSLTDARVTLYPSHHVAWLEATTAERVPQFMRRADITLACRWTVGFSDGTSLTFPEERRHDGREDEQAELLASALADLLSC